jgi:23S rRNA pseudouridine1911/1915/1917 synthase
MPAPAPSWKTPRDRSGSEVEPSAPPVRSLILPGGKVDPDAVRLAIGDADQSDLSSDDADGESEGLCRVSFRLSHDLNKRLDRYLTDRITFMSRNQLQRLIEVGGVTVNGRAPKASTRLKLNDLVEVAVPPPPSTEIQPEDIPLNIVFEDQWFIVINKGPDLLVHPARSHHSGTLLNALVHHLKVNAPAAGPGASGLSSVGKEQARPGIVHRLDRHTSGVMVVAKDDEAHWKLGRQFENRVVDKRYLALVHGVIESDADVIEAPIGPHHSKVKGLREKMIVRHDLLGKPAVTIYRVRQRFRPPQWDQSAGSFTLVELELKTGRTHQIRVHLAHLGYPLVGDDMYGGRHLEPGALVPEGAAAELPPRFERQALHAALLGFHHPATNTPVVFTAPLPPDMAWIIARLREHWDAGPPVCIPGATIDLDAALPAGA